MTKKILCVDDELNILQAYKRQLHKHFALETVLSGAEGLEMLRERGPFAVVVSDMQMPGMNGAQFLAKAREIAPDTVRIILTGQADINVAIASVNEGNIFRFLTKPCAPESLLKTLHTGIEQYQLVTAERTLLEKTLNGSVKVLTDVLALVNPSAFGRALRLKRYASHIATELRLKGVWQYELAAMLSQLGCVTLPADTLEKVYAGQALSAEEQLMYDSHPSVGQDLLAPIPRLETVAAMIAKQHEPCGEATNPEELNRQDAVTAGACILKAALDFDQLLTRGLSRRKAAKELSNQPDVYHPEVVASLQSMNTSYNKMITSMARLRDLRAGMILDEDINTSTGTLVIAKDHEVTYALMQRLRSYATKVKIVEPFRVRMPYYER